MHAAPLKKLPTGGVRNREHAKELHDGDKPYDFRGFSSCAF